VGSLANADRPTLVIVTADHGEGLGEHAEETHGVFGYETTLRVPLVVARVGPGGDDARGGMTVDAPARLIDVLPTVLEAVAIDADTGLPGTSLRPLLRGGTDDRPTYFEAMSPSLTRGWAPLRGVISGREKYIDLPVPELYDLVSDPGEQRNVASVQPERVAALGRVMATFDAPPAATPAGATPEVFERLRALGYRNSTPRARDRYTEADDPKRLVEYDRVMDAATVAFEEGRYQDASVALQQVVVERPGNAEAYRMLAVVFWHGGLPNQAILTLQAAMSAGLPQAGNRVTFAQMLSMTAGAPRAIKLLEDQTEDDLGALAALGIAYSQVGRSADAERAFNRMLEVDPASGLALQNLGILRLRQERYADAETTLRRAIALDASLSGAYTPLGVALSELGRLDEAIEAWQRAVTLDPAEHLARFNLIVALTTRNREDEARQAAEEFLRTAPPAQYQTQLALVRSLLGGG
jgi:Flp pilus assembly protein TadD